MTCVLQSLHQVVKILDERLPVVRPSTAPSSASPSLFSRSVAPVTIIVPNQQGDGIVVFKDPLDASINTHKYENLMFIQMSMLITYNHPIAIYSHEQGCGKATLMKNLLTNLSHLRSISTGEPKCFLRDEVFQYTLPLFTHGKVIQSTKYILWFEDVKSENMDLIRSLIDEYSSSKQQSLNIVVTGQSLYSYPVRFTRHFVPILIHQPISTLIPSIYSIPIKNWLEEFSIDAISHPLELAHAYPYTGQYQESNDTQMSTALRSCQSQMGKLTHMDLTILPCTMRHITNLVRVFSLLQHGHALLRANQNGLGRPNLVRFAAFIAQQSFYDAHSYTPMMNENESVKQCFRTNYLLAGLKQKNIVIVIRENLLSKQMIEELYLFICEGHYPGLYLNEELIRLTAALSPGLPNNRRTTKTNSAVEDCLEEEKLINEMKIALERLKKDVEAAVENANPQYENALNALRLLNKADYDEIRTFRQPPQPVIALMNTICIMFDRKPEWSEAKILTTKDDFFDDLVFYDKDNVSDEVFDMLTKIVSFDTFTPSYVAAASKAASSLCAWILAVYEYAKVARAQKSLREQVKAYEKLYNKRQKILGEKRLYAEKLKEELADFISKRREQFAELQSKVKRLNHLRSVIEQTRAMLKLIDNDIHHWQEEVKQAKLNQQTAITDTLQIALYFTYLSQFNIDQRQQCLLQWQKDILQTLLPIRTDFNLLHMIMNEKELNEYLLKYDSTSINDQNSILNAVILANQLNTTFVLFVNNPETDILPWHDLLLDFNEEIANYDQLKTYQRISSSKTNITEVTEKSSVWESSSVASRPGTGTCLSKPVGKVSLNDFEQKKYSINIPEFSLEEYERPINNIIHLSGKQSDDFDKDLLTIMFFSNIVIVNKWDLLDLNPFIYRFLHWFSRHDQYSSTFPNLYRFDDQEIFINSSFRLILNYHQIDRLQWRNLLFNDRSINMGLSLNKLENEFWLRLIEYRCQKDFIKQIRTNHARQLMCLNEQYKRRL
ncbi:hypothetical protein I4U23_010112 [Adineta vaga]|nr:hypothetical protein I4U23_010112 [Adineta vaga]